MNLEAAAISKNLLKLKDLHMDVDIFKEIVHPN